MSPRDSKRFPKNNKEISDNLPGQEPEEDSDDINDSTDGGSGNSSGNSSNGEEVSNEGNGDEPEPGVRDRRGQRRRLLREYRTLLRARSREERLLAQEIALRDQIAREVEIMERRNQMLRLQRARDLAELRELETESSDDEDQEGAKNSTYGNVHTLTGTNEAEADEATKGDEKGRG